MTITTVPVPNWTAPLMTLTLTQIEAIANSLEMKPTDLLNRLYDDAKAND